uniref:Uncharacterized protein n=1 Tax=Candidatus Kentrum sp. SD TaxID=2126332 RepID=A0A450YPL3_9GAMM|nr:MAG: hypothetical protein BECKSD772F_GA0070984_102424 [Candidatus Kentron sp. SD]VFK43484.1 MAG: hypothetical protein BECKSD772E_GA0070983_102612 [Candidatus Kentron sp. SD]VFK79567.1 MAG: hypothetical protein BECKSD772D_GA0070982_10551 [Candidatus Kentron sp. SD]
MSAVNQPLTLEEIAGYARAHIGGWLAEESFAKPAVVYDKGSCPNVAQSSAPAARLVLDRKAIYQLARLRLGPMNHNSAQC